jgi:prepilin-type N-terminal cleavage/methylation domain-containing protein
MKEKRGFTLVELLVVIAIIALLMSILMPVLGRIRLVAWRTVCANNIGEIGKAMIVYAHDNSGTYPRSGGKNSIWTDKRYIKQFYAVTEGGAFGEDGATVSSCLYLLVKYAGAHPKQFNCKGDRGVIEMKIDDLQIPTSGALVPRFEQLWDFGSTAPCPYLPGMACSYSYQDPFQKDNPLSDPKYEARPANTTSLPDTPVLADRNPIYDKNANPGYWEGQDGACIKPRWETLDDETARVNDPDKTCNSASHQRDGQNVLYNDSHVNFELSPRCGIDKDNIWKHWAEGLTNPQPKDLQYGKLGQTYQVGAYGPMSNEDAWLINERNDSGSTK